MAWYDFITGPGGRKISGLVDESASTTQQRNDLNAQGSAASAFADQGQRGYGSLGAEGDNVRRMLMEQATGQRSVSGEMLRQGLDQQQAMQQSYAASAAPRDAAMAARAAANNMGRASYGMSGQAAVAGMQEKMAAQKALADMILAQRQQDMQVGLGSRQNAIAGYGGVTPEKSLLEKYLPIINAGTSLAATAATGGKK